MNHPQQPNKSKQQIAVTPTNETSTASVTSYPRTKHILFIYFIIISNVLFSGYLFYLCNTKQNPVALAASNQTQQLQAELNNLKTLITNKLAEPQETRTPDTTPETTSERHSSVTQPQTQANTEILSKLIILQNNIASLPLKIPFQAASSASWPDHLNQSLHQIKSFIIIRHHKKPIEPLTNPEARSLLNERLELTIQEATWAVLNHNTAVYQWALNSVNTKVIQQFDSQNPKTQSFLKTLNQLLLENVS